MTVHFAIDQVQGLTLPNGEIVGMSDSLTTLRANGFAAGTYTGNRLAQIEESDSGWNPNCVPRLTDSGTGETINNGWYWVNNAVSAGFVTDLDDLKDALYAWQRQVIGWTEALQTHGVAQPPAKEAQGRARLLSACGYLYLICRNSSHSLANRKILTANMTTGAQDIRKVDDFYGTDTVNFPPSDSNSHNTFGTSSRWHAWVNIATPATKIRLSDTQAFVIGNIPTGTLLLDPEWVANISS